MARNKRYKHYSTFRAEFPSVFIAFAWIAMWFLWPSGEKPLRRIREVDTPRVSYLCHVVDDNKPYKDPTMLFLPSRFGFVNVLKQEEGITEVVTSHPPGPPRFLGLRDAQTKDSTAPRHESVCETASRDMGTYRPYCREGNVFTRKAERDMRLFVEISSELEKYGFEVPEFPAESVKRSGKPWMVTVHVATDDDGMTKHVFLETGCEDQEVNAMVVKTVGRGRLSKRGKRCEGRIVVNYGLVPSAEE